MKHKGYLFSITILTLISCTQTRKGEGQDSTSVKPDAVSNEVHPGVYFVNINDGDKLKSPVIIQMGVRGMEVEPAGKVVEGKGHHHLIIDGTFIEKGQVVPMDKTHLHFGKGQTTDTLKLAPGKHTITLQFANGIHDSFGKDWSKTIAVTIVE